MASASRLSSSSSRPLTAQACADMRSCAADSSGSRSFKDSSYRWSKKCAVARRRLVSSIAFCVAFGGAETSAFSYWVTVFSSCVSSGATRVSVAVVPLETVDLSKSARGNVGVQSVWNRVIQHVDRFCAELVPKSFSPHIAVLVEPCIPDPETRSVNHIPARVPQRPRRRQDEARSIKEL